MSYGKHNTPSTIKATRKADRPQLDQLRRTDPKQIVENQDLLDDDCYGYTGFVKTVKSEPRERTQSGKLGHHTEAKQSRLLQDLELDDRHNTNQGEQE
mgnify:CR=1 FL=1